MRVNSPFSRYMVVDRFDGVNVHSGRGKGWVEGVDVVVVVGLACVDEVGCCVVGVVSKIWVISMGLFQASSR